MGAYIEVHGPNAENIANTLAKWYDTIYAKDKIDDGVWDVEVTDRLEKEICWDDETYENTIREISNATGVSIPLKSIVF